MRFLIVVNTKGGGVAAYTDALEHAGVLLDARGRCWTIEVKSEAEAMVWASRCPARDDETIEILQV